MGIVLLLLMVGLPIIEVAVFIGVGERIGVWPTVAGVVLTAAIGAALLRIQGLSTLFRAQESLNRGVFPIVEVFDGLCLLVAGALLLTPGFVTDAIGLALFIPPVRAGLRMWLGRFLRDHGYLHVRAGGAAGRPNGDGPGGGATIIDGDYEDVTPAGNDAPPGGAPDRRPNEDRTLPPR